MVFFGVAEAEAQNAANKIVDNESEEWKVD